MQEAIKEKRRAHVLIQSTHTHNRLQCRFPDSMKHARLYPCTITYAYISPDRSARGECRCVGGDVFHHLHLEVCIHPWTKKRGKEKWRSKVPYHKRNIAHQCSPAGVYTLVCPQESTSVTKWPFTISSTTCCKSCCAKEWVKNQINRLWKSEAERGHKEN